MTYFQQLRDFQATYKLNTVEILKLRVLYPLFKVHFWLYHGSPARRRFAKLIFRILPKKYFLTVNLKMPSFEAPLPVPVWLQPDRLTSFREIFWAHGYRLKPGWKPELLIDAGANAGYVSLYVAGHSSIRNILAIEANNNFREPLEWASRVLAKRGIRMQIAIGAVVGSARDLMLEFAESDRDSKVADASATDHSPGKAVVVKGNTLAAWLTESGLQEAATKTGVLLKADIEGSEYEVLGDKPEVVNSLDYLVMEVHGAREKRDILVSQIAEAHRILERLSSPAYPDVEILFSEHQRVKSY